MLFHSQAFPTEKKLKNVKRCSKRARILKSGLKKPNVYKFDLILVIFSAFNQVFPPVTCLSSLNSCCLPTALFAFSVSFMLYVFSLFFMLSFLQGLCAVLFCSPFLAILTNLILFFM